MATKHRIHITGASGSGTTTLGKALAAALDVPQYDTDTYYWLPTDPPFSEKRPIAERLALLGPLLAHDGWVLSGSVVSWGNPLMRFADTVVFVVTPTDIRMQRLRRRESERYGDAIAPGGRMHAGSQEFLAWASRYDEPDFPSRSRARHEEWLRAIALPVIRVDGTRPVAELVEQVMIALRAR